MEAALPKPRHTDPAARNFIQSMRWRAIRLFQAADQRALDAIRRDPSINHGRPDSTSWQEQVAAGTLTCHASLGPVTVDGVQTYRTRFELNGQPISLRDAERVAMGEPLEGAA
jgi:hypothetical protein